MQEYKVKVIPNARSHSVTEEPNGMLKVKVTVPPEDGKANVAVLEVLAAYFGVKKSKLSIQSGHWQRTKTIVVDD